jgi:hypothetical protein
MIRTVGDWDRLAKTLTVPLLNKSIEKYSKVASNRAGLLVVREIKRQIRRVTSPPNSVITSRRKGSSSPLMDSGDLFGAPTHVVLGPFVVWVGIPAGKTNRETGISLATIARVLEGGEVGKPPRDTYIRPKRAQALFVPLKKDVRPRQEGLVRGEDFILMGEVRIQPRPFIGPAVKKSEKAVMKIYETAVKAAIVELTS